MKRVMFLHLLAQDPGEVRHGAPIAHTMSVKPFEQLGDPVRRLAPILKLGLQSFDRLRFDIRPHEET